MLRKLLKYLLLIVNIIFAAMLIVSGAARWLNPAQHTTVAIIGMFFPILMLINLLMALCWLLMLKKNALLSLTVVLLFVHRYISFSTDSDASGGLQLRVLTYNTHNFGLNQRPEHLQIMHEMVDFVGMQNVDIACFQEYTNGEHTLPVDANIAGKFGYSHICYMPERWVRGDTHSGLATYSRYPIVGRQQIAADGKTDKMIIYTDIKIGNDTLRVFNCHLQSNQFSNGEYEFIQKVNTLDADVYDTSKLDENRSGMLSIVRRMKRAYEWRVRQAATLVDYVRNSPYPTIVCGDFNETQSSYIYRLVVKGMCDSDQLGSIAMHNTYRRFFPGIRIDYILYNADMRRVSCEVPAFDLSDHRPVVAEYKLHQH